jgi:transcriptional regulator with XRE-family HTH domain
VRPDQTALIDVEESRKPTIAFPDSTGVAVRQADANDDERPGSGSLIDWILGVRATAAEVVRPPQAESRVATGPTTQHPFFIFTVSGDHFGRLNFPAAIPPVVKTGVIARRLEEAREVLGATTEEIGAAVGVSRASLFAWANGTTMPRPPSRRGLDRLFGVTGVAVQIFGLQSAREWLAGGSPSRAERVLSGDVDSIARELDQLVSVPPRGQRPARFEKDEEPELLDEGW